MSGEKTEYCQHRNMKPFKNFVYLSLFGIAFGYVEAAVVIYLRALYYPTGFDLNVSIGFPFIFFGATPFLQPIPLPMLLTEVGREAATIAMLVSVALLAGKGLRERIAFFLWPFAVWDIFYYVFLKLIIGWPAAWSTVDILFLIPVPWLAPVWLPLTVSCLMLVSSLLLLRGRK